MRDSKIEKRKLFFNILKNKVRLANLGYGAEMLSSRITIVLEGRNVNDPSLCCW